VHVDFSRDEVPTRAKHAVATPRSLSAITQFHQVQVGLILTLFHFLKDSSLLIRHQTFKVLGH